MRRLLVAVVLLLAGGPSAYAGGHLSAGPIGVAAPLDAVFAEDDAQLAKLIAEGPADIWLRARTYRAPLVIKRPVALRGLFGATIEASGTLIRIDANDVVVENLILRGGNTGVNAKGERNVVRNVRAENNQFGVAFEACHSCLLEGSFIRGPDVHESMRGDGIKLWEAHDSIVRKNHVERVRDVVVWYSRRVVCEDNLVKNSRYGTHFMYAHDSVARRSTLRDNIVGVFVMYSSRLHVEDNIIAGAYGAAGVGIGFKESDGVVATGNSIVGNTTGLYLDRTPRDPREPARFEKNRLGVNDVALRVHGAAKGITFTANTFQHNSDLVEVDGGNDALGISFVGNHYSEYAGYDLDGDGFGDVAFTHGRLSTAVAQDHPSVRFLHGTVAMDLVDAIAKAFPLLSNKPLLVDPKPAMAAP
jgi:nitrous oxidase accessory protein